MSKQGVGRAIATGLIGSLAAVVGSNTSADDIVDVRCHDDIVQVDAAEAEVQTIVEAIAAACNLRYIGHAPIVGTAAMSPAEIPLSEVLERLLVDDSYQLLIADPDSDGPRGALWIFADGEDLPPEARLLFETTLLEGGFSQRRQAVRDLRHLGTDDAVPLLGLALVDPDQRVRSAAMEALSAIGTESAIAAIASIGSSSAAPERAEAAEMLAMTDAPAALEYLEIGLQDPDPAVRVAVLESLADVPGEKGLPLIRGALEDPAPEVRDAALAALESLDDERQFHALFPWEDAD